MNQVQLIARLTSDPTLKATRGGKQVTELRVAIRGVKRADGSDQVDFVDVTAWNGLAEITARHHGVGYHTHPRREAEVIVEAAAHITCTTLGLDTSAQAVPYIAEWAGADPRAAVTRAAGLIDEICAWFDQHLNPSAADTTAHADDEPVEDRCAA